MDRVVLITGCSTGFGRGMVPGFLDAGWTVAATLRQAGSRGGLFAVEAARHPGRLHILELDVTSARDRREALAFVLDRLGRLDCLVNNAGYGLFGALEDLTEEQLRAQLETNYFGAAFMIRDFLPLLRRSKGRIINVSSVVGYCGLPLTSAYCSSKFALEGLSESLRYELEPHGVQVALVEPGRYRTRFGENVAWGEGSFRKGSPYLGQTSGYLRYKERLAADQGAPMEAVVRTVVRLAGVRRMPLRTRAGTDAHAVHYLRRLLPQSLATGLVSRMYRRLVRA